jgi:hypothetical protein
LTKAGSFDLDESGKSRFRNLAAMPSLTHRFAFFSGISGPRTSSNSSAPFQTGFRTIYC